MAKEEHKFGSSIKIRMPEGYKPSPMTKLALSQEEKKVTLEDISKMMLQSNQYNDYMNRLLQADNAFMNSFPSKKRTWKEKIKDSLEEVKRRAENVWRALRGDTFDDWY